MNKLNVMGLMLFSISLNSAVAQDLWGNPQNGATPGAAVPAAVKTPAQATATEKTADKIPAHKATPSKRRKKRDAAAEVKPETSAIQVIYVAPVVPASRSVAEAEPAKPAPVTAATHSNEVEKKSAVSPLLVSGFIDAQFQATSRHSFNGTSNQNSRGFSIHDGALYVSKSVGNGEAKLDIPFSLRDKGGKTIGSGTDSTGANVSVTAGNGVDFDIATVRAQAYVGQKYENGLRWKLGQFDTSYGFEVNDTVDIALSRQGYVYNYTDPFVHTGLQVGYDFSPTYGMNLLAANRKDSGLQRDDRLQYGIQFVSTSVFRWSLGGLYQKALNGLDDLYADLTIGSTFGNTAVDAEVSFNNNEVAAKSTPDRKSVV